MIRASSVKHGHATNGVSPTYVSWAAMKQRCSDAAQKCWNNYGGRGIRVCRRWQKFENFLADMGKRPKNRSLDRIDNEGNYEPGNCRWATIKQQARNKRRFLRSHCRNGHALQGDNVYWWRGKRRCFPCKSAYFRRWKAARV